MLFNKNNEQNIFVESNVIRLSQRFMCFGKPGTRIFPTTGYARVLIFMFIRRELRGTGTGCLFQFTYHEIVPDQSRSSMIWHYFVLHELLLSEYTQRDNFDKI